MAKKTGKQFSREAKSGVRGEAAFESFIAEYAIPHHVVGLKDLGLDFLCEWSYKDEPSGILFGVQVKRRCSSASRRPLREHPLNGLQEYSIQYDKLVISDATASYWKAFGLPIYMFLVWYNPKKKCDDLFYKRVTPLFTKVGNGTDESITKNEWQSEYFEVSNGREFTAFADPSPRQRGFARDLFIDCVRLAYAKGRLQYPDPDLLGLEQYAPDAVFEDLFADYRAAFRGSFEAIFDILSDHDKTWLEQFLSQRIVETEPPSA